MRLTPPKETTFWTSVVLGLLGAVGAVVPSLPLLSDCAHWFIAAALVLLLLGNTTEGL